MEYRVSVPSIDMAFRQAVEEAVMNSNDDMVSLDEVLQNLRREVISYIECSRTDSVLLTDAEGQS